MDVIEIREKREACEEKIRQALEEFSEETEIIIQSVSVQTESNVWTPSEQLFLVEVTAII